MDFPLSSFLLFPKSQTPIHLQTANTRSTNFFLKLHQGVEEDDDDEVPGVLMETAGNILVNLEL